MLRTRLTPEALAKYRLKLGSVRMSSISSNTMASAEKTTSFCLFSIVMSSLRLESTAWFFVFFTSQPLYRMGGELAYKF